MKRYPGQGLLILRHVRYLESIDVAPLAAIFGRIGARAAAITLLSNSNPALNPFRGLTMDRHTAGLIEEDGNAVNLVQLLGPGQLHPAPVWPDHILLLSGKAIEGLVTAGHSGGTLPALRDAGGDLLIPDWLFLHDSQCPISAPLKLDPNESPCPPPWSELSARLRTWLTPAAIDAARPSRYSHGVYIAHYPQLGGWNRSLGGIVHRRRSR